MNSIEQSACELLAQDRQIVLATIVRHKGATPRTAGSKMIVTREGHGIGTIGGGSLEAGVMARAAELIEQGKSQLMRFDLNSELVTDMDMICGGRVDVLLAWVPATRSNRYLFRQWRQVLEKNKRGCLVTVAVPTDETAYRTTHRLVTPDGTLSGPLPLEPAAVQETLDAARTLTGIHSLWFGETLVVLEPSTVAATALLFGAGHVARPTARLAAMVGFRVFVLDDRPTYAHPQRFPEAQVVKVLDSFEQAFAGLEVTADSYVVIFTRGHLHDKVVLAQALATNAGYIGMIGSRRKRDAIYDALEAEGVPRSRIDHVQCPVGLAIAAETPEEIAVSIVAEMIHHRAQQRHKQK